MVARITVVMAVSVVATLPTSTQSMIHMTVAMGVAELPFTAPGSGRIGNGPPSVEDLVDSAPKEDRRTVKAPHAAKSLWERARALKAAGQAREAEVLYRQLLHRNPQHPDALFELSVLLFESGRYQESSQHLERLLAIRADDPVLRPVLLTNLGEAYRRQGELARAAAAFAHILAVDPDFPEAHQNLGITLMNSGRPDQALPRLERAVALRPDNASFHVSLAWVLFQLHRIEESLAHCRRALELDPTQAMAHHHLANALVELGDRAGAILSYRLAFKLDPSDHNAHSNLILVALTNPAYDARALLAEARRWARLHAEPLREFQQPHKNDRNPDRPLRIGYLSPDFRAHPVHQFLTPLLAHHDQTAFEIYLYASVDHPDLATDLYRAWAGDRFRDIRYLDDVAAAELVRKDRIDILVDLALHSAGGRLRLFACKPAPVQITWLGYAGTTGLDTIDYRITDPYVDPPGTDLSLYSEACLHLPETSWCYDPLELDLPVSPLPALATGVVTFGCQNSYRKVHPGVLSLWARVLCELPTSRLFLYAEGPGRDITLRQLAAAGISSERVELGGRVSRRAYLERYQRIDIALDTFPFTGATTSLDALWMGVPVVTLTGGTSLHRAGTCLAMNLGLPELIASSEDDFVAKAVALASNLPRLATLRAELRTRLEASPLGDAPRFARNLEAAFRTAWQHYCASV
jgi:protein O-GlcNAc transferase